MKGKAKTSSELYAAIAALERRLAELEREQSARRTAEDALRESREQFRALIDATGEDVVVLLDADQRIVIINEHAAKGFGRSVSELLGKRIEDLIPSPVGAKRKAMQERVLGEGKAVRFEDERNGRWFDNNMCPVFSSDGEPRGVAIFARDITARKEIEHALEAAKVEAERANLAKSRFLAAANHDLRQPLQAISFLLGALSYAGLREGGKEMVSDMTNALRAMEELLNALLDISKLDAGILLPKVRDFHLVPFLHRMHSQFRSQAQQQGVRMRVFPADALVSTDPDLLARIVQNFVSNAVRHTRRGEILLGCRRANGGVRIEVWDRGPGIAEDQVDQIFEEFYQLGEVSRGCRQGLGLGLAIARRIASLLGVRIGVRSTLGKGSVFFVEIPATAAGAQRPVAVRAPEELVFHSGGNVLLVEDDEQVRNATARLLRLWGFRPLCASSAEDAIEALRTETLPPVLALVDYRLPGVRNGVELSHALRDEFGPDLPVILLTGDTEAGRLRDARTSGCRLLHKPVSPAVLRQAVLEGVSNRDGPGATATDDHNHQF